MNDYLKAFVGVAVVMAVIDYFWLSNIGSHYMEIVRRIQGGSEVEFNLFAAAIVYIALTYLALIPKSYKEAFLVGVTAYATYDFTVMALFKKYPFYLAVSDTLWGGILFTLVFFVRQRVKWLNP